MNTAVRKLQRAYDLSNYVQVNSLPVNGVFILAILVSAIAVVFTTNQYRVSFSEFEQLKRQHHQLIVEKNQLLTEKTYFARHDRLKTIAMDSLSMRDPATINYID